jgi:hypothetical protein
MKSIANLESTIRDLINHPRKRYSLSKDPAQWYKLCSSMDAIGDTELAINSYLKIIKNKAETENEGHLYILLYGILQILFVQQDAVENLTDALDLQYEPSETLLKIRDIRNDSIGHPTKRGGGKGKSFNFITRMSMTKHGFKLMTVNADRETKFQQVDIYKLINEQREVLRIILKEVITHLKKEAMKHNKQYKKEKLADVFHPMLTYYYEKIASAIFSSEDFEKEYGKGMLNIVAEIIEEFKTALEKRQLIKSYELEDDFIWTEYSLQKIFKYFENSEKESLNEKDAYIYFSYLKKQIDKLHQIAKEIDEEYQVNKRKK